MKSCMVLAVLVAAALAAPAKEDSEAQVVRYDSDNIGVDGYNFNFETSNGIKQAESGKVKNLGAENEAIEATGSFSYVGSDGITYAVTYIANENGFQPQGAHIPV